MKFDFGYILYFVPENHLVYLYILQWQSSGEILMRVWLANKDQLLLQDWIISLGESGEMSISNKNWTEAVTSCNRPAARFNDLSAYNVDIGTTGWTGITRQNYGRIWATGKVALYNM